MPAPSPEEIERAIVNQRSRSPHSEPAFRYVSEDPHATIGGFPIESVEVGSHESASEVVVRLRLADSSRWREAVARTSRENDDAGYSSMHEFLIELMPPETVQVSSDTSGPLPQQMFLAGGSGQERVSSWFFRDETDSALRGGLPNSGLAPALAHGGTIYIYDDGPQEIIVPGVSPA